MPIIPKAKRPSWLPAKDNSRWTKGAAGDFYDSTLWRSIRKRALQKHPICLFCKQDNIITESQVVDHVIPIELGGSKTDANNLQGICTHHHNVKTAIECKCNSLLILKASFESRKGGVGVKNFWHF